MGKKQSLGTRLPVETKAEFVEKSAKMGMNPSEGLRYVIDLFLTGEEIASAVNQDFPDTYEEPYEPDETISTMETETPEEKPAITEEELLETGYDELDALFEDNPLRSAQAECEIRNAYAEAANSGESPLEVVFLELLSERLRKLSRAREGYSCPRTDIELPGRIVEHVEKLYTDAFNESNTGEADEVLEIMSNLAESKAAQLYNATRKIEISFSRNDWRLIDRMVSRENRTRSKEAKLKGLRELIYEFLATKVKERSSTSFFASSDPEMIEFSEALQSISITGENRSYE